MSHKFSLTKKKTIKFWKLKRKRKKEDEGDWPWNLLLVGVEDLAEVFLE